MVIKPYLVHINTSWHLPECHHMAHQPTTPSPHQHPMKTQEHEEGVWGRGGVEREYKKDKEGIYAGTKGAPHCFFFIFCFTNKWGGYPSHLSFRLDLTWLGRMQPLPSLFDPFWHEWGGFNPSLLVIDMFRRNWGGRNPSPPFSTPFDMNGEGSTPACLFVTRFDAIEEGITPPHLFSTRFNVEGEGLTPPCLF